MQQYEIVVKKMEDECVDSFTSDCTDNYNKPKMPWIHCNKKTGAIENNDAPLEYNYPFAYLI